MPAVILNNLRYTKNAVKTIYIYISKSIYIYFKSAKLLSHIWSSSTDTQETK